MTPDLLAIVARRLTHPEAARDLATLHKAIRVGSPVVHLRYEHLLETSGALENPETTPEERDALVSALSPEREGRDEILRVRVSDRERQYLHEQAGEQGVTLSEFVRQRCGL